MNIKILLRVTLEIVCAFGLLYVYVIEVQQRHFLHFSNGCYLTVWNAKYLIAGKYYGVMLPKSYAEINTNSATSLSSNIVLGNKLIMRDKNISDERFEYRIKVDADPIPTFYIESKKQIVATYPLFINPIVSASIDSVIPFFIVTLTVVFFNYLAHHLAFCGMIANRGGNILRVLLECIMVMVMVVGLSLGLL